MKGFMVLLVEDETALAEIIAESLGSKGFGVTLAHTCRSAADIYRKSRPDVIVLDVMLPDGNGFDLAADIRRADLATPILFLTSRSRPEDVVAGFETGGNDYLKKPFSIAELIVRLRALLNRDRLAMKAVQTPVTDVFVIGTYRLRYPSGLLEHPTMQRTLTSREADILRLLFLHRNDIMQRDVLLKDLWETADYFAGRSLDVFISKLRGYLKADPSVVLVNVRGKGYKLVF